MIKYIYNIYIKRNDRKSIFWMIDFFFFYLNLTLRRPSALIIMNKFPGSTIQNVIEKKKNLHEVPWFVYIRELCIHRDSKQSMRLYLSNLSWLDTSYLIQILLGVENECGEKAKEQNKLLFLNDS